MLFKIIFNFAFFVFLGTNVYYAMLYQKMSEDLEMIKMNCKAIHKKTKQPSNKK